MEFQNLANTSHRQRVSAAQAPPTLHNLWVGTGAFGRLRAEHIPPHFSLLLFAQRPLESQQV